MRVNYSFLTVCSSDNYLTGVLALNESLKAVNSKYPLQVLMTKNTSTVVKDKLSSLGIQTIYVEKEIKLPSEVIEKNNQLGYSQWNYTLDKLWMFELVQFDKLVYLDSDMVVLHNIDELFDKPHMAAVVAGKQYPGNEAWELLNSGCMVIVPQRGLVEKFLKVIPQAIKERHAFGDQDILQLYYQEWTEAKELELDEKYNMFFGYLEYYVSKLGYSIKNNHLKNLSVIHFTGEVKPWMKSKRDRDRQYLTYLLKGKINQAYVWRKYCTLIRRIERFSL